MVSLLSVPFSSDATSRYQGSCQTGFCLILDGHYRPLPCPRFGFSLDHLWLLSSPQ